MDELSNDNRCQAEDVAAYIDGELGGSALESFEAHLRTCAQCAEELRLQRQLLCTLDAAFSGSRSFALPQNFTRVVAAHAESDMSGMHKKSERRRALQLCAILTLASFALLGAASRVLVFQPARSFLRVAGSLCELVWRTIYDGGTGIDVIVRMVGRAVLLSPYGLGLFLALAFLIAVSLLPRLIASYHRAQIIE
jgi:hypothetical protein